MRIPDWLVYVVVLAVVVVTLFANDRPEAKWTPSDPLSAAESAEVLGRLEAGARRLNPPHPLDEKVLVNVGDAEDGIGTAFAIHTSGIWLTARHVVDGCREVDLSLPDGRLISVDATRTSDSSDLALLLTDRAPTALIIDFERELMVGETGYHVGFPQGRSGEAMSQLLARSRLVTRGRYDLDEPVLAWVERERSGGIEGTLAGMSGGPVFDADGTVVGVTVAESPRRGRIYTAAPGSVKEFLEDQGVVVPASVLQAKPLSASTLPGDAARLRQSLAIVKVVCQVNTW
jgi:S1-C subfamily serine protease